MRIPIRFLLCGGPRQSSFFQVGDGLAQAGKQQDQLLRIFRQPGFHLLDLARPGRPQIALPGQGLFEVYQTRQLVELRLAGIGAECAGEGPLLTGLSSIPFEQRPGTQNDHADEGRGRGGREGPIASDPLAQLRDCTGLVGRHDPVFQVRAQV